MECIKCKEEKDECEFLVYNKKTGARRNQCKGCRSKAHKQWVSENIDKVRESKRKYAAANRDKATIYARHYRKTKRGFLCSTFTNMTGRVQGKNKPWLYKGLPICDRHEFIEWSINDRMFNSLFQDWERSGYELKKCPSIDRLDSNGGYTFGNMGWITQSENSQRGAFSRWGFE